MPVTRTELVGLARQPFCSSSSRTHPTSALGSIASIALNHMYTPFVVSPRPAYGFISRLLFYYRKNRTQCHRPRPKYGRGAIPKDHFRVRLGPLPWSSPGRNHLHGGQLLRRHGPSASSLIIVRMPSPPRADQRSNTNQLDQVSRQTQFGR